jgi:hypothetical protein
MEEQDVVHTADLAVAVADLEVAVAEAVAWEEVVVVEEDKTRSK